ncbi:PQQ-dependent sugar dehydrogenase [Chitiniphilus purpureus]|uniref:PQQ-dependent sugar dehydrogenase n=1 Tax=Chitiniphilus purpureus TaxID=2981137 RepID=A0ABY6DII5_9NEIS|nr:PQQ-dependent sugar dehydrogenase [Chitiniphilus sp. CD1]UXY14160.1 PQQ-dependent sugar dehydrogenase [Chitiniphilus sp. CD1]
MSARLLAGCLSGSLLILSPLAQAVPKPTQSDAYTVQTVVTGLAHPWSLAFLPDGRMLVTERPGRLRIIGRDGKPGAPVAGIPTVFASGQGGLLDVALDPQYAQNRLIYLSYAEPGDKGVAGTAVARATLQEAGGHASLQQLKVIFRQQPKVSGDNHFGSRLAFARDGTLFVTLGERKQRDNAQQLGMTLGKVVRIAPDGSVPADNPFKAKSDALPQIWSYGHRNPQGAAINPADGQLWLVDHGARGGDEVNVVQAGRNYGWPVITYGRDYTWLKIGEGTAKPGMEQPRHHWDPSIAPSGMAFYTGQRYPGWKDSLLVGALKDRMLVRLALDGERIVGEERLLTDLEQRVRDVRQGPDGWVYLLTDADPGAVLRVVPR